MPQPKVSIIIPVYNTKEYLVCCLESVCQQTEQNIEIIIIDDASPDNSWAIIQDYATRDSRIRAIRHLENKHLGGARNTGIEAARCEWLLFLDSDDYLRSDAVEILLSAVKEYPELELIIFGIWRVLPEGKLEVYGNMPPSPILLRDILREYCTSRDITILHCACGKLWRRSLFKNIRFSEHMSMEDFALVPCLFANLKDKKTLILAQRLYFYQWRKTSLNNHYNKQTAADFGRAFYTLQELAAQLAAEKCRLLENRMQQEFHAVLQRKQSQDPEFQISLVEHVPKDLLSKSLWKLLSKLHQTRQNHQKLQQNHGQLQDHFHQTSNELLQAQDQLHQTSDELLQVKDQLDQTSNELLQAQDQFHQTSDKLFQAQDQLAQTQQERWYRFGHLSRKRKLWVFARGLSKRLGIYRLLWPLAKIAKGILEKKK